MGTSGKTDEAKGRAKEAAGSLIDDKDLKRKGKAEKTAGKAKQKSDKAIDKAKDAMKD
jgi:uncharacterized protein YjbJ (UPF0337 family)